MVRLKKYPEFARDIETVIASRPVGGMEAQSLIVTARHRVALQIVDRARRGQESRTATALPERVVCAGQEGAT